MLVDISSKNGYFLSILDWVYIGQKTKIILKCVFNSNDVIDNNNAVFEAFNSLLFCHNIYI